MIVVNARFLTQDMRGVQRFAEQICLELQRLRDDLVFVAPQGIRLEETARRLQVRCIGRHQGHLWEQLDLPLWLARQGRPLLLSLGNTAPLLHAPQIATLHDITFVRHPQSYSRGFTLAYRLLMPLLLRRVQRLITVSQFSRQEIASHYRFASSRIAVVTNAVASHFKPAEDAPVGERPYLLAVSSLNAHKNFERMVQAFLSLPDCQDVELRIVGGAHAIFASPDGLGAGDPRIRLLGRLDEQALLAQYRGASAFVFPSLYEGFGIPPLEAQACGCPVIAARAASIPEVLGDSALLFDPLDTAQIADSMRRVLHDSALRQRLRRRGLANAARFSWRHSAEKVSRLIDGAPHAGLAPFGRPIEDP